VEWIATLRGKVVGVDTMPVIYLLRRTLLLNAKNLTTKMLSQEITEEAARLRARHNLRTPDSIQMATAIHAKASFFLTNDDRLLDLPKPKLLILDKLRVAP